MSDFMTTFKESLLILLFEFLGTLLLTALWNSCFYAGGDPTGLLCGFFILLIFSARISGSHFNPAVTLSFMFRKDVSGGSGRFSRVLGILYIASQYGGAILGGIMSYNLFQANPGDEDLPEWAVDAGLATEPMSIKKGGDDGSTTLLV